MWCRGKAISRMLKKSASGVLASFRPSPYPESTTRFPDTAVSPASTDLALIILRAVDLAAALLDDLLSILQVY